MRTVWKVALAAGAVVLGRELYLSFGPRRWARRQLFAQAQQRARDTGKALLVVGDPHTGFVTRLFGADYGCGQTCTDLTGCPVCADGLAGDLVAMLKRLPTASHVVYVSCTLEYVPDARAAIAELERVAGGDLFVATVEPWSLTAFLYPGAQRRFFAAPPAQSHFDWQQLPWRGGGAHARQQ